jgi:hypothetical protein
LFIDANIKGLLGGEIAQIQPPQHRGVSTNMEKPENYINALHAHLTHNNVFLNSGQIFAAAEFFDSIPDRLLTSTNKIDDTITWGMLMTEIRCRRAPRPAWSAPLADASRTVKYWKKIKLCGMQTNTDVSESQRKLGADLKWESHPEVQNTTQAKEGVKTAQKELNKCRKEATELRQSFLDDRIEAAVEADDTTSEKILKNLRHREAQSACFRKLAYVLKSKGAKGGVAKVELQVDGITVAFTEKSDVERETKRRNKAHFNQPAGSPFTVFPLSELGTTATKFKTNILPNGQSV